jgi:hypothetical protein
MEKEVMNMHETIVIWLNDRMNKIVAAILPYASVQISVFALYLSVFSLKYPYYLIYFEMC